MTLSIFEKLRILVKSFRILDNWYLYPLIYFKLTKKEHAVLRTRNGIKIKLRVFSTDLIAFTHVWILEEYKQKGFEIKNNHIVIDIGAHIGLFTLYASQFCKSGKIYCFEPVPENFKLLSENLILNKIQNVIAKQCAISNKSGYVKIYLNEDASGNSMHVSGTESVQAESISLKDVIDNNNLNRIDYLKIDCEGEEYEIINSLPVSYFDMIQNMCIEYHFADERPLLIKDLIQKISSLSYTTSSRSISESIGFLYATK